jgi:hypothetical protein
LLGPPHFFAIDRNVRRGVDADLDPTVTDRLDLDNDLIADYDLFALPACKD